MAVSGIAGLILVIGMIRCRLPASEFPVIGVAEVVDWFARFALQGLGTPAPVAPPRKLVVTGLQCHISRLSKLFRLPIRSRVLPCAS